MANVKHVILRPGQTDGQWQTCDPSGQDRLMANGKHVTIEAWAD